MEIFLNTTTTTNNNNGDDLVKAEEQMKNWMQRKQNSFRARYGSRNNRTEILNG